MANPVDVTCVKDSWTKVATNVQTGFIHKQHTDPNVYLQTYRETGDPAPVSRTATGAVLAFENSLTEPVSATAGIDVYFWVDKVAGQVSVQIP